MARYVLNIVCALMAIAAVSAVEPPVVLNWMEGMPYAPVTLTSGQKLELNWMGDVHNVYKVPSMVCPKSWAGLPIEAPTGPTGMFAYTCSTPGVAYYACGVSDHCDEGQIIKVTCT